MMKKLKKIKKQNVRNAAYKIRERKRLRRQKIRTEHILEAKELIKQIERQALAAHRAKMAGRMRKRPSTNKSAVVETQKMLDDATTEAPIE